MQRASIMKMGRRLKSWLILRIRGKLPIGEELANCQAEKSAFYGDALNFKRLLQYEITAQPGHAAIMAQLMESRGGKIQIAV